MKNHLTSAVETYLESTFENMAKKLKAEQKRPEDKEADRLFTLGERAIFVTLVSMCLGSVLLLSWLNVLNGTAAGTLIGCISGYALGHLRSK